MYVIEIATRRGYEVYNIVRKVVDTYGEALIEALNYADGRMVEIREVFGDDRRVSGADFLATVEED